MTKFSWNEKLKYSFWKRSFARVEGWISATWVNSCSCLVNKGHFATLGKSFWPKFWKSLFLVCALKNHCLYHCHYDPFHLFRMLHINWIQELVPQACWEDHRGSILLDRPAWKLWRNRRKRITRIWYSLRWEMILGVRFVLEDELESNKLNLLAWWEVNQWGLLSWIQALRAEDF